MTMDKMSSTNSGRNMAARAATDKADVLVLGLRAVGDGHLSLVGGKAFNLGKMIAAGLPVPSGFCITTTAFDFFLASCPRRTDLTHLLVQCSGDELGRNGDLSREIRSCLEEVHVPEEVKDAALSAWRDLGEKRSFAVRSSATVEDAAGMSFAGQFETILNVRGADVLLAAIKTCWLSIFSKQALVYLARQRTPAEKVKMAVLVQEMIEAEHAGVVFTADPLTGATDRFVIECVSGLGEGLVQGTVQPERMVVDKRTGRVLASSGDELLSPGSLKELCDLTRRTENLFGSPQDIEWAQRAGEIFLLQSRPITTKATVRTWEDRQVWTNLNTGEVAPDVMTPMTWSMMQSLLGVVGTMFRLLGADMTRAPIAGLVAGRLYFNVNTVLAAVKPFTFLLNYFMVKGSPDFFQALGGISMEEWRQGPLAIAPEDLPDLGFRWPKYFLSWPRIFFDVLTHSSRRGGCAWLAHFEKQTDDLDRLDLMAMSTPELTRLGVQAIGKVFKKTDVFYLATQGAVLPIFQKACSDWLGEPGLALRLFAALGGLPVAEAGLALWRLALLAHARRDTETVVSSENNWPEVRTRLCRTEHGRKFLTAWDNFLAEHGHHCRGEFELSNARWCETPDYILGLVRGYLRALGQSDPLENQRRLSEEREQLTVQCSARLKNPIKRWIFSHSLRRAQQLTVFREQLKNLGIRRFAFARRVFLVLGQRLHEQGSLCCRDDIFFLEVSELESVATGGASFDGRGRIELRRREYERNLKCSPPQIVNGRFDPDAARRPVVNADAKLLEGIAVSPGMVTGPARVILRTDDHEQVLPGEILVAPFTDPAWSPYFITAAGLIMEQGGILSHGSIVAREYGLPAVTNVASATRIIRTGDLVQVDGIRGCVSILKCLVENSTAEIPQTSNE
jgi:phosphohistidine swiveling domain-containing protein